MMRPEPGLVRGIIEDTSMLPEQSTTVGASVDLSFMPDVDTVMDIILYKMAGPLCPNGSW